MSHWEVQDSLVRCEELQMAFPMQLRLNCKGPVLGFAVLAYLMPNGHQKELGKLFYKSGLLRKVWFP